LTKESAMNLDASYLPAFCPNCGTAVTSSGLFCPSCGNQFAGASRRTSSPATVVHGDPVAGLVTSGAQGAVVALGLGLMAMALMSAVLFSSPKYAVGLLGVVLGAAFHITGTIGGVLGAPSVGASVSLHVPLTAVAVLPGGALFIGGWWAARRSDAQSDGGWSPLLPGACAGAVFAVLLLLLNVVANAGFQSAAMPTFLWALAWGVPLAALGSAWQRTRVRPGDELMRTLSLVARFPALDGLPEFARAGGRALRSLAGVLGVYGTLLALVVAFKTGGAVPGGALVAFVALATFGMTLLKGPRDTPRAGAALLAAAAALLALTLLLCKALVALIVFLPTVVLASAYWVQGAVFGVSVTDTLGNLGPFGSVSSGSATVAHTAMWSGTKAGIVLTVALVPAFVALAWHLFAAGSGVVRRQQQLPQTNTVAALKGASVALPWAVVLACLHGLVSASLSGGVTLLGNVSGTAGPTLLSSFMGPLCFAGLFGSLGGVAARRASAAEGFPTPPFLLRWTVRQSRAWETFRHVFRGTVILMHGPNARPPAPALGARRDAPSVQPSMASHEASIPDAAHHAESATAPAAPESPPRATLDDAIRASGQAWERLRHAVARSPQAWECLRHAVARVPRPRRGYVIACGVLVLLAVTGLVANAWNQGRKDRAAVVTAVRDEMTTMRSAAGVSGELANDMTAPPLSVTRPGYVQSYGRIQVGRISARSAKATVTATVKLLPDWPALYGTSGAVLAHVRWAVVLVGSSADRAWTVFELDENGPTITTPTARPAPSSADAASAEQVAGQALKAAFSLTATVQGAQFYNSAQPDSYLTSPATSTQMTHLADNSGSLVATPPFVYQTLSSAPVGSAVELMNGALVGTSGCSGDEAIGATSATVGDWSVASSNQGVIPGLQHVELTGTVHVAAQQATCTDSFSGDVSPESPAADLPVDVVMARPNIAGFGDRWRIESIRSAQSEGTTTIYQPYSGGSYLKPASGNALASPSNTTAGTANDIGATPSPAKTSSQATITTPNATNSPTADTSSAAPTQLTSLTAWHLPTDDIGCALEGPTTLRCDVTSLTDTPPPAPADCMLDYGNAFAMSAVGPTQLMCAGDTIIDTSTPVLEYGQTVHIGAFTCMSAKTGMTCTTSDGHGLFLSRGVQRAY
jgi:hypothetical protein